MHFLNALLADLHTKCLPMILGMWCFVTFFVHLAKYLNFMCVRSQLPFIIFDTIYVNDLYFFVIIRHTIVQLKYSLSMLI